MKIEERSDGSWIVTPALLKGPATIDVGNAGTVMRFLPPIAALAKGLIHFDGDERSHERPVAPIIMEVFKRWSVAMPDESVKIYGAGRVIGEVIAKI